MGQTIINGKLIEKFVYKVGGVEKDLSRAYMNGKLIFQKSITLSLTQGSSEINLAAFIAANNPKNYTTIYVNNTLIQPRIVTGDLSGLEVVFTNSGEIRGVELNRDALQITSQLVVINKGYIRGAGGDGGAGGKGLNTTKTTESWTEPAYKYRFNMWRPEPGLGYDDLFWNGCQAHAAVSSYGPQSSCGAVLYRGIYVEDRNGLPCFKIKSKTTTSSTITGGAGGSGGDGVSFDRNISYGQAGKASSPTGGNSGGAGGTGGNWGIPGVPGAQGAGPGNAGSPGQSAGRAIVGAEYLAGGSSVGNVNGAVVNSNGTSAASHVKPFVSTETVSETIVVDYSK